MNGKFLFLSLGLLIAQHTQAEPQADMEGMSIIGNREMPNILYIIPWKSPTMPDMEDMPLSSLIDQALQPLDRKTVLREEQYYNALNAQHAAQQPQTSTQEK
jgi:hypothetical protein